MIKKQKVIAKRYAEAFCNSVEEKDFAEAFKDFQAFSALYFGYEGLSEVLLHPTIHVDRKTAMLQRIFGKTANAMVTNFICLLIKRNRLNLFERISYEVEQIYREKHGITGIIIKSAVPLLPQEKLRLRAVLALKFGRIEIREVVAPEILGGLIIQFTDQVVDESIRNRLKQLHELMVKVDKEWLATLITQPTIAL